mgnify:CR=1 FL=1
MGYSRICPSRFNGIFAPHMGERMAFHNSDPDWNEIAFLNKYGEFSWRVELSFEQHLRRLQTMSKIEPIGR